MKISGAILERAISLYRVGLGLVLLSGLSVFPAAGQTIHYWNAWDPADVDFHAPAHWSPAGPPGELDAARFNQPDTNAVVLSSAVTNASLMVQQLLAAAGVDMTFDLGGNTWTLTATGGGEDAGLAVGRSTVGTMRLTNGTLAVGSYAIGINNGSDAVMILSGTNTLLTSTTGSYVGYHDGSRGTLRIEDGARALLFNLRSGIYTGSQSDSLVVVTGSGSLLQTSEALRMQGGTVLIEAGGRAVVGTLASPSTWTDNQYLVTGAGSSMVVTNALSIEAGSLTYAAGATGSAHSMSIGEQGHWTITGAGTSVTGGLERLNVRGQMTVSDGARFESQRTLDTPIRVMSDTGNAQLVIESGGTFLGAQDLLVGYFGSNREGTVIVRDAGSRLETGRHLELATWNVNGINMTGRLLVHTGGVAAVGGDLVLTDSSADRQAHVEVRGAGARIEAANAYLGGDSSSSFGAADLTVADTGTLEVSGMVRVWETAELALDGGTVAAGALDLKPGATLKVTLHTGGTNALITAAGTATLTDALFDLSLADGFTSYVGETFTIIDGDTTGVFAGLGASITIGEYEFDVHYNSFALTTTVIPEPGILALLGLGGMLLLMRRRRRGQTVISDQ